MVKKEKIKVKSKVLPHIGTQIKGKTQSNVNHAQKAATKSDLMQENKCIVVSQILKSLSHPQRLAILCHLLHREMSVGELAESCGLSQPQISQFVNRMKLEELLDSKKDGKFSIYFISNLRIRSLIEALEKIYC